MLKDRKALSGRCLNRVLIFPDTNEPINYLGRDLVIFAIKESDWHTLVIKELVLNH